MHCSRNQKHHNSYATRLQTDKPMGPFVVFFAQFLILFISSGKRRTPARFKQPEPFFDVFQRTPEYVFAVEEIRRRNWLGKDQSSGRIHILSEICIGAIVADESFFYTTIFLFISCIKKLFEVIAMLFVEDRKYEDPFQV